MTIYKSKNAEQLPHMFLTGDHFYIQYIKYISSWPSAQELKIYSCLNFGNVRDTFIIGLSFIFFFEFLDF